MRTLLAGLVSLGLVTAAFAQPPGGQPPTPPPQPATPDSGAIQMNQPPAPPPGPPARPIPEGPVVKKTDLEGGLIAEDIKIGEGAEVQPGAALVAYYHGTLKSDGSVFDSAFQRGEPFVFQLDGVIEGWKKGVPGMKAGGVRKLTIPSALAYGAMGSPPKIPANADLVFIVEVVDAVSITDVKVGDGEEIWGMCVAVTTFSAKDAEGKEVDKAEASKPYAWIPGEVNKPGTQFDAMQVGLKGMKVGGTRRIHIPALMNQGPPPQQLALTRPMNIALDIEVNLLSIRNLQPKPAPPPPPAPTAPTGAPAGDAVPPPAPTGR